MVITAQATNMVKFICLRNIDRVLGPGWVRPEFAESSTQPEGLRPSGWVEKSTQVKREGMVATQNELDSAKIL